MDRIHRRKNLIVAISLMLVVGFLTTSLISYYIARTSVREQIVSNSLPLTSDNIYSELQRDLVRPILISSLMAQDTFVRDWMVGGEKDADQIAKYLGEIKRKYNTHTCFLVSDASMKYYYPEGVLKELHTEDELDKWYFRVRAMDGDYETNVDPDMANANSMTIFINYKVLDYAGNYIGATGVGLKVSALIDLLKQYGRKYSRNVYLTDRSGKIVLSSSNAYENIAEIEGTDSICSEILSDGGGAFDYKCNGDRVFLNSRLVEELNWFLLVEEREGLATRGISNALFLNLFICGVITLAIILIVAFSITIYEKVNKQQEATIVDQHNQLEENNRKLGQANHKKNQLLQILCHDLANPFGALISSLSSIEMDPAMLDELLPEIKEALSNGMGTIDLVREMRAVEEGKVDLSIRSTPLKPMILESATMLKGKYQEKHIALNLEVDDAVTVSVEQVSFTNSVLNNLLTNAIKFSGRNSEICIKADVSDDGKVRIIVADHGIGMPESIREALFDMTGNRTRAGTDGEIGTGFGMPLVEQFIGAFGGQIEVRSKDINEFPQDHGTEVVVTLNP